MQNEETTRALAGLERYCRALHDQREADFAALWADDACPTLTAPDGARYEGVEALCQDFLIGRIQRAYTWFELLPEDVEAHPISADEMRVEFAFKTSCDMRDTGKPFGIEGHERQTWVRRGDAWKLARVEASQDPKRWATDDQAI